MHTISWFYVTLALWNSSFIEKACVHTISWTNGWTKIGYHNATGKWIIKMWYVKSGYGLAATPKNDLDPLL